MAEQYLRQSPLAHLHLVARANNQIADATSEAEVFLGERNFRQQWVLRGKADDEQFVTAVRSITGCDLPVTTNTVHVNGDISVLWLGPDEWLLIMPDDTNTGSELISATRDCHAAVVNVSESRTIISLSGPEARNLLARGCALDLHTDNFALNACAQTTLAHMHVILHLRATAPVFDILVHRSFAEHMWIWLEDAAREYNLAITPPD